MARALCQLTRHRFFVVDHKLFYLFTLNLNTLHHWFIFNRQTALDLAESAARDDDGASRAGTSVGGALLRPQRRSGHAHRE